MIILHIGFPKTATTALQKLFFTHAQNFEKQGLFYPLYDQDFKQRYLKAFLCRKDGGRRVPSLQNRHLLESLETGIRTSHAPCILLSCEELTNELDFDLSAKELSPLVDFLRPLGREIVVLAYVRNPVDYYLSRMQEHLKYNSGVVRPQEYVSRFAWTLKQFETAFDVTARVRLFEREHLVGGSITSDFFAAISDLITVDIGDMSEARVNESLSAEAMFCLDLMHSAAKVRGQRNGMEAGAAQQVWKGLQKAAKRMKYFEKPKLYANVVETLSLRLQDDFEGLQKSYDIRFAPAQSLAVSNPMPYDTLLTSVEEIVPVNRSLAFKLLSQALS